MQNGLSSHPHQLGHKKDEPNTSLFNLYKKTTQSTQSNGQRKGYKPRWGYYKTCVHFWYFIGEDYHEMIIQTMHSSKLPQVVNKGLITLIFKIGDKVNISN
jgi:hypothetical protein